MEVKASDLALLEKIASYEETMTPGQKDLGWTWMDVSLHPAVIARLLLRGMLKCTYKSRSSTNYMLTETGRNARGVVESSLPSLAPTLDADSMFSDIVGYNDLKELLRESLQLDKPIHVLMYGPPSIAKSMFIWDIERAGGEHTLPLLGSATSHAGLWDLIAEKRPRWILIDELEKMGLVDMAGLLSLMEQGRIIRAKVGRKLDEKLTCWVVATANRINKLPPELLSRFARFQLSEYNSQEYVSVVENVLAKREGVEPADAHNIALMLVGTTHDVRDAVRVARLSKRVGVQRAVELLIRR